MREREKGLRIEESDSESGSGTESVKRLNCLDLVFVVQWGRI